MFLSKASDVRPQSLFQVDSTTYAFLKILRDLFYRFGIFDMTYVWERLWLKISSWLISGQCKAVRQDDFEGWCHLELEKFSPPWHESILSQGQES